MLNWITILSNVVLDVLLVTVLVTGRMARRTWPWGGPKWVDRRENPYFYWFFTILLGVACVLTGLTLAEQVVPGFHAPALLG